MLPLSLCLPRRGAILRSVQECVTLPRLHPFVTLTVLVIQHDHRRMSALTEAPVEIGLVPRIKRLNADYFKPWLPAKKDRCVVEVEDLSHITYKETVLRLVCLMYVAHEDHWLDLSLRNLTGNWLHHVEECFTGVNGGGPCGPKVCILQSYLSLNQPVVFVSTFRNILLQRSSSWLMRTNHTFSTSHNVLVRSQPHSFPS